MDRLAIIGGGRMGGALVRALLRAGVVTADAVTCTDRPELVEELSRTLGVNATADNAKAIAAADVVVLAVKPQVLPDVLATAAGSFRPDQVVVSIAAGITTERIEQLVGDGIPVVRVMPNTPMQVDMAMSVLAPGRHATEAHLGIARSLLEPVGQVAVVDESQMDAVTAVSGSGPAYFFLVAELMIEAGIAVGLAPELAAQLVTQTFAGAAAMLSHSEESPSALREQVTSPGGTTAAALTVLEEAGIRPAFLDAIAAAKTRGGELAAS